MSDTKKLKFGFNTAISKIDEKTGKWDEKAHSELVKPLRGRIMQIDGACGCFIARYGMEVDYITSVTDTETVVEAVRSAVRQAALGAGFFPLRGEKRPTATYEEPAKLTYENHWWVARVLFSTDLFVDKYKVSTIELTDELMALLANADGARQPGAGQRRLYVKFDTRQTSSESMTAHLEKVVAWIMDKRKGDGADLYFPFAEPTFSYEVYATPYLI